MSEFDQALTAAIRSGVMIAKAAEELNPEFGAAQAMRHLEGFTPMVAQLYLAEKIRDELRRETLEAERKAKDGRESEEGYKDGLARINRRYDEQLRSSLHELITQYSRTLVVEWTQDLLVKSFALRSGELVLWGRATPAQHQERVEIYMANVLANAEGAALHLKAIDDLEHHQASCLADITEKD